MDATRRDWAALYLWLIAACLFLGLVGLHLDIGSHLWAPRDTFWEPQHVLMYAPLLSATALTFGYVFWLQRRPGEPGAAGVRLPFFARPVPAPVLLMGVGFFLIPIGGLFDQWWHTHLGQRETLYSLSHIFTIMGGAMAGLGLLLALVQAPGGSRGVVLPLFFGGFLVLAGLMMGPFDYVDSLKDYAWFIGHRPAVHYGFALDPRLNLFETSIALGLDRQNGLLFPPIAAAAMLPLLALLRRMSSRHWAATEAALFYTAARLPLAFALSPATGRWPFLALPLPVLVPALVLDFCRRREGAPPLPPVHRPVSHPRGDLVAGAAAGGAFGVALAAATGAIHPLGLAGAVAAGAVSARVAGPVASLLAGVTPRQAVALVLLLGLAVPVGLGLFDLKMRGIL